MEQIDVLSICGSTREESLNRALQTCSEVVVLRQGEVVARGSASIDGFASEAEHAYFGQTPEISVEEGR